MMTYFSYGGILVNWLALRSLWSQCISFRGRGSVSWDIRSDRSTNSGVRGVIDHRWGDEGGIEGSSYLLTGG